MQIPWCYQLKKGADRFIITKRNTEGLERIARSVTGGVDNRLKGGKWIKEK